MSEHFFERPILSSPYAYPARHWELDGDGQPTNRIIATRRRCELITPVPKPQKRRRRAAGQAEMVLDDDEGLSTAEQQYDVTRIINEIRGYVENWRTLPNPNQWQVTPETARLIQHWRHHQFENLRPFFCRIEAVETAIWLAEVASDRAAAGARIWTHLRGANREANPELLRIALKLATGAGKTTVMAMLIAWQTVNAVRHPGSNRFSRAFLVITLGITIKDRLRVLLPNDPNNYYRERELVPNDMLGDIERAKIVITNYHAFRRREKDQGSKVNRSLRQGRGPEPNTIETEGEMLRRACSDLMGLKNVVVLNDEAHHCYREKPQPDDGEKLKGEDREDAKKNNEAARLWISGIETVKRKLGLAAVYDLSATPFFLRGSSYAEGTLFPWTVSDFSLMDAIECGIVKLPRVPVADNMPGGDMPKFRNIWEHLRGSDLPKKGRGKSGKLDPLKIPALLQTALEALYGHYAKTFALWEEAGIAVPPVFIIVCNNTATSKLVYDYISGFDREQEDGTKVLENGRLPLFRNYDDYGNRLARPRTLLIDSEQLESGEALDDDFRKMAGDEIERFRRDLAQRTGNIAAGEKNHRPRPAALGYEYGRQAGPARREHSLRRLGRDADRGLGRQHRHPHPRGARVRHAAAVRAGCRPRAAPAILRAERRRAAAGRLCRRARHSVRLCRQAGRGPAGQATRDGSGACGAPRPRQSGDQISTGRRLSRRSA
jgi:type III restriction enzyme